MIQLLINIYNSDEYILYKITHCLLIISTLIAIISYSIAINQLRHQNDIFIRWCIGTSVFAFVYAITALVIDFKRRYDFSRNDFIFLVFDFLFLLLIFSISVSGSVFWKEGNNNMGKDGYNTGNVSLWISWIILIVITIQDYKQNINSIL